MVITKMVLGANCLTKAQHKADCCKAFLRHQKAATFNFVKAYYSKAQVLMKAWRGIRRFSEI